MMQWFHYCKTCKYSGGYISDDPCVNCLCEQLPVGYQPRGCHVLEASSCKGCGQNSECTKLNVLRWGDGEGYTRPKFYDTAERVRGVRVGDTIIIKLKVREVDEDSDIPLCVGNKEDSGTWIWLNLSQLEDFVVVRKKEGE